MAEALKMPQGIPRENIPKTENPLAKEIGVLTDKGLDDLYDKITDSIKRRKATIDELELELEKENNTNIHSLDAHKITKEIAVLNEKLTFVTHEMNKRMRADYKK